MNTSEKIWRLKPPYKDIDKISNTLNINNIVAQTMLNRGLHTLDDAKKYLNPDMSMLRDISEMKDVLKAFPIILEAIKNKDLITIYGDYDVDGVTSTTILLKGLRFLGANANYYIPHREEEGYGLNVNAVETLAENGTNLLITCDNGIASVLEIEKAIECNLKVIVIDHHEPSYEETEISGELTKTFFIPSANCVIDPKQHDCPFPFKQMCAAGICYRFIMTFYDYIRNNPEECNFIDIEKINENYKVLNEEFIIFATIATFCDVVDLQDDNRIIAKTGLKLMNENFIHNLGLKALIKQKSLEDKEIMEYHIGFIIGPCINASGRLTTAAIPVELFLAETEDECTMHAEFVVKINDERKLLTENALNKTLEMLALSEYKNDDIIILYNEEIHESIAGIIAGRIKETIYHPVLMFTKSGEHIKASGRSIPSYNMFEELSKCKELFIRFGGHPMAAGLSMMEENLEVLRKKLNENSKLTANDFKEVISIDYSLNPEQATFELVESLKILSPFGKGNKKPCFGSKNMLVSYLNIKPEKNTLIITFSIPNTNRKIKAISFDLLPKFTEEITSFFKDDLDTVDKILNGILRTVNIYMDILYYLEINEYNGNISVQLKLQDIKISKNTCYV